MKKKNILIVDDSIENQRALKEEFHKNGFDTDCVSSGEEALEVVQAKEYNFIFLDYMLPGQNGIQTYKTLKSLCPNTKVILISGYASDISIGSEEVTFVQKPFKGSKVLNILNTCLENNHRREKVVH